MSLQPYEPLARTLDPMRETGVERAARLDRVPERFLSFIAMQTEKGRKGYAYDLRWCAGLCRNDP